MVTGSRRIKGLDGIRAFAVVGVIAAHAHLPVLYGGGVGVDIFFGLSGYLITSLLLRERTTTGTLVLAKFWGRRALRLLPALFVLLILVDGFSVVARHHLSSEWHHGLVATPAIIFYFSNWLIVHHYLIGQYGPLWSLSVEEQFYMVWPLVMVAAFRGRRPLRTLTGVASSLIAIVIIDRLLTFHPADLTRVFATDYRIDGMLAGALLAIAFSAGWHERISRLSEVLVVPAVVYLIIVAIFTPRFGSTNQQGLVWAYFTIGLPLVAVATQSLIGFVVTHQDGRLVQALSQRVLDYTGRISYGMYLWHYAIIWVIGIWAKQSAVLFVVALALTYLAAGLSWRFVERPLSARLHERLTVRATETPLSGTKKPVVLTAFQHSGSD